MKISTPTFLALVAVVGCQKQSPPANEPGVQACTKEAKVCSDGSTVGRTGPNCEFAKCPGPENEEL